MQHLRNTDGTTGSHFVLSLTLSLAVLAPSVLAAESYFGIGVGMSYTADQPLDGVDAELDFDVGFWNGALTYGRWYENGWSLELEAAYRRSELEIVRTGQPPGFFVTGTENALHGLSLMMNASRRFDFQWPVTPYLGGGIGVSAVFLELTDETPGSGEYVRDTAAAFAYQLYAGLLVPLGDRWRLAADYRWRQTAEFDMSTADDESISLDYTSRMLSLNFQRLLGGARNPEARSLPSERDGFYVDGRIGTAIASDTDITTRFDTTLDAFDLGVAGALALGYTHVRPTGRRLRAELEFHGWSNEADVIDFGYFEGEVPLTGEVQVRGASLNVIYDLIPGWTLNPYAGLGIGYADVDYDIRVWNGSGYEPWVRDSHEGMSAQALLGFGIRLTTRAELSMNYRYWLAPSIELTDPMGATIGTEHGTHLLMLGLRYNL